jgi:hypothetical protein
MFPENILLKWVNIQNYYNDHINKHNRLDMVAVLGLYEALPYYIHDHIKMIKFNKYCHVFE